MERIDIKEVTRDGNRVLADLGRTFSVCKVNVTLKGLENIKGEDVYVDVLYAMNGVTTDLVTFGKLRAKSGNEIVKNSSEGLTFVNDYAGSVSHICVYTSHNEVEIDEIQVYEKTENNEFLEYPGFKDFDLKKNYYLDKLSVFTDAEGYFQYKIYTSLNGRDFYLLTEKNSTKPCNMETGDIFDDRGVEARYVRLYVEYSSASPYVKIKDLKFEGRESGTEIQKRPEIFVENFEDSKYNVQITENDTYQELYGIIARTVGKEYCSWFSFELTNDDGVDYFELSDKDGKINVKGNSGVNIAMGINHYLKYFCNVHISQVGNQTKMPKVMARVNTPVHKETKAKYRYAYNYCTHSYTMGFWGENEWRKELDWLALNGVNIVLDITGQEEVWRRFLLERGYSLDEAKGFIAGPPYYAWAYMANITGLGGPVHDSWFQERTQLARKNQLIMRKLGMEPIMQGFSGMVPPDIKKYDQDAEIIIQGNWGARKRPDMLRTTGKSFSKYARDFYRIQKEVYGDISHFYATDPFHEGGNPGDMSPRDIARITLEEMVKADPNGIWVIQSWQDNPTSELLVGVAEVENGKNHALILDLFAENVQNYKDGKEGNKFHGYSEEFDHTPWLYCMLNNFGGRLGMYGHIDSVASGVPEAFNNCDSILGIGITPEASENNPVLYDFFFESVWQNSIKDKMEEISLEKWLCDYATRRYGKESDSANKAWQILKETAYKALNNELGQGAPESVINAVPDLEVSAASTWGNSIIKYDKEEFKNVGELILKDYDLLKDSEAYLYDVADVLEQILSNSAQEVHLLMADAYKKGDKDEFRKQAERFVKIIDYVDETVGSSEYFLLGRWTKQAEALAENTDDFTKRIFELHAKAIVTTWSYYRASKEGLNDYSNRKWAGLTKNFYKNRWLYWVEQRRKELDGKDYDKDIDWFNREWNWVREEKSYSNKPTKVDFKNLWEKIKNVY